VSEQYIVLSVDISPLSPYLFVAFMGTNVPLSLKVCINNILCHPEIALWKFIIVNVKKKKVRFIQLLTCRTGEKLNLIGCYLWRRKKYAYLANIKRCLCHFGHAFHRFALPAVPGRFFPPSRDKWPYGSWQFVARHFVPETENYLPRGCKEILLQPSFLVMDKADNLAE